MAKGKTLEEVAIETEEFMRRIKHKARVLFSMAYKGRLSMQKLYEKGMELEEETTHIYPNFWDDKGFSELKDAFEFIDELHDSTTKHYHSKNREQIYYHMRQLSD